MAVQFANLKAVFDTLVGAQLTGDGPPDVPWTGAPTAAALDELIAADADGLPIAFHTAYVDPLRRNLARVLRQTARDPVTLEALAGAVYDHGVDEVAAPLRRFLAVVSNLYRSFLDAETRARANLPLVEQLPPLAMFQHSGQEGPFTIPADDIDQLFGGRVGVVSLPSRCRDHPFAWVSLAHETGGHDVLHADRGLLEELSTGVEDFFGVGTVDPAQLTGAQAVGLLWSYWIDEAASDVYGLLNMGPAFAMNLVVFLAAIVATFEGTSEPVLRAQSGRLATDDLDVHPVDLLRPHLAIGAIESLGGLAQSVRADYAATLADMADRCSGGATTIDIVGTMRPREGGPLVFQNAFPLGPMQDAARRVGAFIASTHLNALGGHGIQDLETWDDSDEAAARRIADTFARDASAVGVGDDAQLLAGATLAILDAPEAYDAVSRRVEEALDHSFDVDPIWGAPRRELMWFATRRIDAGYFLDRYSGPVRLIDSEAPKIAAG